MTIEIETVQQVRDQGYSVSVRCWKCKYNGPTLDLDKYIRQGRGHLRPIELKLKHARCKTLLDLSLHPPKGYGK